MVLPDLLLIFGVLLGGVSVYVAASSFINNLSDSKNTSLMWADGGTPKKSKSGLIRICRPLVHRLVLPILSRYKLTEYKKDLKREIQCAGLSQELNEEEYIGLQIFLGVMLPLFILLINFLFNLDYPWWVMVLFGIMGFAFPYLHVRGHKTLRCAQILVDLPFVIDLLALSTEAGLDFIGAISKVVEKMANGPFAEELAIVLRDLRLGSSRSQALTALSWRINMTQVSSFIAVLVTADSLGASIGDVLRQQSEQMRHERFVRAEKAGVEASQKIYLPLIVFIMPAVLIMLFGPVIIQFMGGGK